DRLVFAASARERLLAPRIPVDRVVRVLLEIGRSLIGGAGGGCGGGGGGRGNFISLFFEGNWIEPTHGSRLRQPVAWSLHHLEGAYRYGVHGGDSRRVRPDRVEQPHPGEGDRARHRGRSHRPHRKRGRHRA